MPSANVPDAINVLSGVSALSPTDVWAVGYSVKGNIASTMTQHWDGTAWRVVPSPNPNAGHNQLDGVAAISADNVWAVGSSGSSNQLQSIIIHWDGKEWLPARLPQLEPAGNTLYSISAVSANDVWAVGATGELNNRPRALTMHYNGVDWQVIPNPVRGSAEVLNSVSARASNDVWAVGGFASELGVKGLIKHWNGREWSNDARPQDQPLPQREFFAVTALAPDNAWAVGEKYIEHWDGSSWGGVPSPQQAKDINKMYGIAAVSANDIGIVGYSKEKASDPPRALISHWNGVEWGLVGIPQAQGGDALYGVDALPSGEVFAVGAVGPEGASVALVQRYADLCAPPPPTPINPPVSATGTPTVPAASTAAPTVPAIPIPGTGSRTFSETGKTASGLFLEYWETHGGLAQQGYPISDVFGEVSDLNGQPYTVQYFERAVFEYHPENQPPFNVLLSQLGTFQYKRKYKDGAPNQQPNMSAGSVVFQETGKRLGGKFLAYWREHGGLAQQGLPISDEFMEKSDLDGKEYLVQYFERAVFEYHPENQSPFDVLLSQLGTFQYKRKYGNN
ncbi:MAG TPA: hypothetical protein VEW94_02235 [Chloroflexia bacterium]|nr:hypothetical protein [Chloroflexia bacterium]